MANLNEFTAELAVVLHKSGVTLSGKKDEKGLPLVSIPGDNECLLTLSEAIDRVLCGSVAGVLAHLEASKAEKEKPATIGGGLIIGGGQIG